MEDPMSFLIMYLRAAQGDEEAEEAIKAQSISEFVNRVFALEKMTELKIEPGSFLLGMAFHDHGWEAFVNQTHREHLIKMADEVREMYAEQA